MGVIAIGVGETSNPRLREEQRPYGLHPDKRGIPAVLLPE